MNNDPNDRDLEQQSQGANSELTLEALRYELGELKEEIRLELTSKSNKIRSLSY